MVTLVERAYLLPVFGVWGVTPGKFLKIQVYFGDIKSSKV